MKKIMILITIFSLFCSMARAQSDTTQTQTTSAFELSLGYNQYGLHVGLPKWDFKVLWPLSSRWFIGGGICFEGGFSHKEKNVDSSFPFEKFDVTIAKFYGPEIVALYHLGKGFVEIEGKVYLNNAFRFEAWDKRCEIEYSDGEGFTSTSQRFEIRRADGKRLTPMVEESIVISYIIPVWRMIFVKLSFGYDIVPFIKKELVNTNAQYCSNWDKFEFYYGNPTINLYETSPVVRQLCSMKQYYFGISVCGMTF